MLVLGMQCLVVRWRLLVVVERKCCIVFVLFLRCLPPLVFDLGCLWRSVLAYVLVHHPWTLSSSSCWLSTCLPLHSRPPLASLTKTPLSPFLCCRRICFKLCGICGVLGREVGFGFSMNSWLISVLVCVPFTTFRSTIGCGTGCFY